MRMDHVIDQFVAAKRKRGDFTSDSTCKAYYDTLILHCQDCGYRDPALTKKADVERTLDRWENPNTAAKCLAHIRSFYKWCVYRDICKYNPADAVEPPKRQAPNVYRWTREETQRFLLAADTPLERRVAYLGVCAGLRRVEIRGMQRRHFLREGFVWVSKDIAKGRVQRFIPVITDLQPVVAEILENVADDEYVIPAQRWSDPGRNTQRINLNKPASFQVLKTIVENVGERAGIPHHAHCHQMRHGFGDHFARGAGLMAAKDMMGHADVSTTSKNYVGRSTLDELAAVAAGFSFFGEQRFATHQNTTQIAREAPTRIELVDRLNRVDLRPE